MRTKTLPTTPMRRPLAMAFACAVVGLLGSLPGCLGQDLTAPPATPVDSTLILRLREEVSPDARRLFLEVRTSTEFPCFNYRVDHVAGIEGRRIRVEFTGVSIGEICLAAIGPARATVPLGTLAAGSYDLVLTVRGQAQLRVLTVSPEAYTVRPARGPWTVFEDPVLIRVP